MMQRLCDRCGVPAPNLTPTTLVIPQGSPSTAKVAEDFGVSLGLSLGGAVDLCPLCQSSALLEYIATLLGPNFSILATAFMKRAKAKP